jgi:hypothetical protein
MEGYNMMPTDIISLITIAVVAVLVAVTRTLLISEIVHQNRMKGK